MAAAAAVATTDAPEGKEDGSNGLNPNKSDEQLSNGISLEESSELASGEQTPSTMAAECPDSSAAEAETCAEAELPTASADLDQTDSTLPEETVPEYPAEFEKYWKAAQDNPLEFSAWTELLQYIEQENHIFAARKAYDSFFNRYPYCYGYWKKYADMERRFDFHKEAEEVCLQGLQAIPLSLDLWIHYVTYLQETLDMNNPESTLKIRSVFESAVAAAGMDFHSDKLWEMYMDWEKEQGELKAVTAIYNRVISVPTQLYSHHFEKYKEHVMNNLPKDILTTDELLWMKSKVTTEAEEPSAEPEEEDAPPGDDAPPGVDIADQESEVSLLGESDREKARELLIAMQQEFYTLNEQQVSLRWNFEEGIKRPYFHVRPLERAQLKNWRDYLDFEIANGSHERVIVLFERCVIACALYEEFWIKYAKYLEGHSIDRTRNVFQRACGVHLPKKPNVHLHWAMFEEKQGNLEESRRIMRSFDEAVPGLAIVGLRRANLERRQGNLEEAESLLREVIRLNEGTPLASFYSSKLARQLVKVQKNLVRARKVLMEAIEKDPENSKLHLNLLELEFSSDVRQNEGNVLNCIERVLQSNLPTEIKIIFSQRRVEFLEDFGSSIQNLLTAYDEHQKLLKQVSTKKRAAENGPTEESQSKKAKDGSLTATTAATTATASSTAMMGGDMTNSQAAYNYGSWYQHYGAYAYQNPWNYNQYYSQS
ncbi:pre-mRNA-processing factor 39 isoform X2 [Latimeria chalumnae]